MTNLTKQLGERIKKIRKTARLTQDRLAERTNLSVEYISRLERGIAQPSFKTLAIIAEVLNVTIKDFFDFENPVSFKNKRQEALEENDYINAILSELKDMKVNELTVAYKVIKALAGKPP